MLFRSYRVEIAAGELVSMWRGRSGDPADVTIDTSDETLRALFSGTVSLAGAVEKGEAAVAGSVSDGQRLLDASPLSAGR